jgi:DNA-directed RNA polymerase subunit RPC12/RpoP
MIKVCSECGGEFDTLFPAKIKARGLIIHCPDCSVETTTRYAGLQAGDGKQSQVTILKFQSEQDRSKYLSFWRNNSGMNKSKSCQLGNHLSTTPNISFETVVQAQNMNHKGKA